MLEGINGISKLLEKGIRERWEQEILPAFLLREEMNTLGWTEEMKELYLGVAPFIQLTLNQVQAVANMSRRYHYNETKI